MTIHPSIHPSIHLLIYFMKKNPEQWLNDRDRSHIVCISGWRLLHTTKTAPYNLRRNIFIHTIFLDSAQVDLLQRFSRAVIKLSILLLVGSHPRNGSTPDWMGRKEMFLFNDTLNTFYLRLYGVGHMVKNHSDSERRNPLPPHGLLFPISSEGSFICTIPHIG